MKFILGLIFANIVLLSFPDLSEAATPDPAGLSGTVVAEIDGEKIQLPLLEADYDIDIEGDAAHVALTQSFLNPTSQPLHGTYLFPLNQKAAVHAMRMEFDGTTIVAQIQLKEKAEATFRKAKAEGKAASLLTQHRPNMFTQKVAHLMPGRPVKITIEYVQTVPKIDGAYELVVPIVVGPRYEKAAVHAPTSSAATKHPAPGDEFAPEANNPVHASVADGWKIDKLPAYPEVIGQDAPAGIDAHRVGLNLSLNAPVPISRLWSDTHDLAISGNDASKSARFKAGRAIDNRDLVLRYELSAEHHISAGLSSHFAAGRGGYYSLLIEPPSLPADEMIARRELVFVLDTSGSMSGKPVETTKTFMRTALKELRPDDYFRILRFSNNTSQFAGDAVLATEANKRAALDYVSGLSAKGGTEINRAINAAFDTIQPANTTRIVVFLTDGYIGDERDVIATISRRIGHARIYAFGIGNSVNRFLLDAMAREGRGYARYVEIGESTHEAAESFAANLETPLLTDISIDWANLAVKDQTPSAIPDLFEGRAVRVLGRYSKGGKHKIYINGLINGRKAQLPLAVDLKSEGKEAGQVANPLPLNWAREMIFDKNRQYTIGGSKDDRIKQEITQLALTYSLQSRFTSFVAVSENIVNSEPASVKAASVPLPQVSGVSRNAYPSLNLSGSSAPEPEGILGVMLILLAVAARFRRRLHRAMRNLISRPKLAASQRRNTGKLDTSLPRSLTRDGWWLED
ncbi:VIT and vWA domain-containing protein [Stappia sediminis]|nr:VIT and VWA domain-containing protein [Stappia sediminis]